MTRHVRLREAGQKTFYDHMKSLTYTRSAWQVWADIMDIFAITLSNTVDKVHFERREKHYLDVMGKYSKAEVKTIRTMFHDYVAAIDSDPFGDFLGEMYMMLELGNHWKGQFFTPYSVSRLMAEISISPNTNQEIEEKGWISVNDCCCGGGAMLIAAADVLNGRKINFQNHALFVAQDIDPVVAKICYIQLSLLGCAGYVKIGDALLEPMTGSTLYAPAGDDIWIMPMYCSELWHWRRTWHGVDRLIAAAPESIKSQSTAKAPQAPIVNPTTSTAQMSMFD